ncbi:MAG: response regulator [Desulfobacterales bacterium]|nr:MAG: response regulator [Desulfobacterales bacterium]
MDKLLLIDDEPDILRVLGISLKADGYEVIPALNGAEGLEAFSKHNPSIVITDIKMPGMDGIEVLEKIKEIDPETEVIIITGHGDIDNAIESLKYGASDFINKPVRDEALSIALARAKEKLDIKRRLREYTTDLEKKIEVATSELRRQTNFQIKLIRSSNDGIVATDQDLKIVIYNPGAEKIFGYSQSEVIYKMRLEALYPTEITDLFQEALRADNSLKDIAWRETEITSKDRQQIPIRFSGSILTEKDREMGTVAFFHDLREIKRLEKELVKSERLAAVGQTVAGLAHGIKNILHGLKGGSYLVDIGIKRDDTEKLKKGWDTIKRNIGRTSNLVMDLLSYSKEREPEYAACIPNEIIRDVCELIKDAAEENKIEITMELDEAIGEVIMDGSIVHEIVLNLASNAVDACLFDENISKRFQIKIQTKMEPDNVITFAVSDNGVGMDDEVLQKLFTSFFSTKGHRGTGLGLMVTRKLIEEHQGKIEVTSQPGQGTTFKVRLPFRAADVGPQGK